MIIRFFTVFFLLIFLDVFSQSQSVKLTIDFDNNPKQTAWRIIKSNGDIIHDGHGKSSNKNLTESFSYDLECGSYSFSFYDKKGNENNNTNGNLGNWTLTLLDETILAEQDGYEWDFFQSIPFCIDDCNCDEIYEVSISGGDQQFCPNENVNLTSNFEINENLNYTLLGNIDGHYYYKSNIKYRWYVAEAIALAMGGNLVEIDSQEISDLLDIVTNESDRVWIGLIQRNFFDNQDADDDWEWNNGNTITNYSNWNNLEPNGTSGTSGQEENLFLGANNQSFANSNESVGEIWGPNSVWNDDNFSKERYFVFEIEPTLSWSNGENVSSLSFQTNDSSSYLSLTLSVADIESSDSIYIDVFEVDSGQTIDHVICPNIDDFSLFDIIDVEELDGVWYDPNSLTGPPNGFLIVEESLEGIYTYEYSDQNNCINTSSVSIIKSDLNAGRDSTIHVCFDDFSFQLSNFLVDHSSNNGEWSTEGISFTESFNPSSDSSGIYIYTVTDDNCTDTSIQDINIIDINTQPITTN